jgi:hypothetical protein
MFVSRYFAIARSSYFLLYLASSSSTILNGFASVIGSDVLIFGNGELPELSG